MERKLAKSLRRAESELNNARLILESEVGHKCEMHERIARIGLELFEMINALEG